MESPRCPACGSPSVFNGSLASTEFTVGIVFLPDNIRTLHRHSASPTIGKVRACLSCGHLWSALDPARLRELIAASGDEVARQHLDEIDRGIYRDLPDIAIAREVAEKVASLDALVREGKTGFVGLYRDIRGVPWDQAIKEAARWRSLTRPEKLALFGWEPKKVEMDELA